MQYICCKQTDIHRCCWGGNNLNSNSHCRYKIIVVSWSKSKYLCLISKNDSMTSSRRDILSESIFDYCSFRPQGKAGCSDGPSRNFLIRPSHRIPSYRKVRVPTQSSQILQQEAREREHPTAQSTNTIVTRKRKANEEFKAAIEKLRLPYAKEKGLKQTYESEVAQLSEFYGCQDDITVEDGTDLSESSAVE